MFEFSAFSGNEWLALQDRLQRRGIFLDGGAGVAGAANNDGNTDGNDDGNTGDDAGSKGSETKPTSFSEEDVERIVKDRLTRERGKIAKDVRIDLERQAALDKATKDGDLQKIIDAQKIELDQYAQIKPIVIEYEALADERYQEALKSLPEALKLLAPDDTATALDKERWLTKKALPAAAKMKADTEKGDQNSANGKPKPGNNPPGFEPLSQTNTKTIDEILKAYRGRGEYRPLM